ncbi:MAG TPA: hypothetical protein VFO06_06000 [Gemmatimonadales bacterium]|nr:hypothetical protein [Gemmatimonadales bacterium]
MSSIDRASSHGVLRFRLSEERERVSGPGAIEGRDRNARTLLKEGPLRVTLVMLRAGGKIAAHRAGGPITVQLLDGDLTFRAAGQEHRLVPGDLLMAVAGLEHDVASEAGGTFLLTLAQPEV